MIRPMSSSPSSVLSYMPHRMGSWVCESRGDKDYSPPLCKVVLATGGMLWMDSSSEADCSPSTDTSSSAVSVSAHSDSDGTALLAQRY